MLFSECTHLTMPKKIVDQNFDLEPYFGNMPLKPKNGPRFENRTPPSAFELGFSYAQIILTFLCQKKLLDWNFDFGPRF